MRLIYPFLLILIGTTSSFAQKGKLDFTDIKASLTSKINHVRDTSNLQKIESDIILNETAMLHSTYCLKNESTKHYQSSDRLKNVKKRLKSIDGYHHNPKEIIIKTSKSKFTTSDELTTKIIRSILRNKTNKKTLLNSSDTHLGISFQENNKYIYTVIVTAIEPVFGKEYTTPQKDYGIKTINEDKNYTCKACIKKLKEMPENVFFDLLIIKDTIFFAFSDETWFNKLFHNKMDGIAVDIVQKKQYPCAAPNIKAGSPLHTGYLLPPKFLKDIYADIRQGESGTLFIPVGVVPEPWRKEEFELNLLLIQDNIMCRYNTFFQIPFGDSETLDLDFDLDITDKSGAYENTIHKKMRFKIPFEQGKYTFNRSDLKPLEDSLRLANYTITDLDITAFSSIEGNEKNNLFLQQKRAESITNVISSYQQADVNTTIKTVENWVDFLNDIQKTEKAYLATKPKEEIRDYVNTKRIATIDTILSRHRKGIINVSLERKTKINTLDKTKITQLLNDVNIQSSEDKYYLIDEVFQTKSKALLQHLKTSVEKDDTWNAESKAKIAIYAYMLDSTLLKHTIGDIARLIVLNKKSSMLQYNYFVLKLIDWEQNFNQPQPKLLKKQIWENTKISISQRNTLGINYGILETAYHSIKGDYKNSILSTKQVAYTSQKTTLTQNEYFKVGKFLANNAFYTEAIEILKPHVNEINVSEDLLFLYINLTIIEDKIVAQSDYRTTLTNASQVNPERFCTLFNSSFTGGITFQLLKNKYLKRNYCELCNE